jgi:hypothetical protein
MTTTSLPANRHQRRDPPRTPKLLQAAHRASFSRPCGARTRTKLVSDRRCVTGVRQHRNIALLVAGCYFMEMLDGRTLSFHEK